jgi:hypothetical protein
MRPEEASFIQEVHVDLRPTALGLSCDRCGTVELVLQDSGDFDDHVKRFMRTHPTACLTHASSS